MQEFQIVCVNNFSEEFEITHEEKKFLLQFPKALDEPCSSLLTGRMAFSTYQFQLKCNFSGNLNLKLI
jgi:hypothetical protein